MSLQIVPLEEFSHLKKVIKKHQSDYWISALSESAHETVHTKLNYMRVAGIPVEQSFTHCFILRVDEIKTVCNTIIQKYGLGLRTKKMYGSNDPGTVFALVNADGYSEVYKQRSALASSDKALSTYDRVARTQLKFEMVDESRITEEAMASDGNFWLTSFVYSDPETAKRHLIAKKIQDVPVGDRFRRCLITQVEDCQVSTTLLEDFCGRGLRKMKNKSNPGWGTLCLLLDMVDVATETSFASGASNAGKQTGGAQQRDEDSDEDVRQKIDNAEMPILKYVARTTPGTPVPQTLGKQVPPTPATAQPGTAGTASSGTTSRAPRKRPARVPQVTMQDLRCQQALVLEKRLNEILPQLPFGSLSTAFVQMKLEEHMNRPKGKFDKFKMDIGRIWRAYAKTLQRKVPRNREEQSAIESRTATAPSGTLGGSEDHDAVPHVVPRGISQDDVERHQASVSTKETTPATSLQPTWGPEAWPSSWPRIPEGTSDSRVARRDPIAATSKRPRRLLTPTTETHESITVEDDDCADDIEVLPEARKVRHARHRKTAFSRKKRLKSNTTFPQLSAEVAVAVDLDDDADAAEPVIAFNDLMGEPHGSVLEQVPATSFVESTNGEDNHGEFDEELGEEIDEFGFEVAMDTLRDANSSADQMSTLKMLLRSSPTQDFLTKTGWEAALAPFCRDGEEEAKNTAITLRDFWRKRRNGASMETRPPTTVIAQPLPQSWREGMSKKPSTTVVAQPLPQGWREVMSKSTGKLYYFNEVTGESTFDQPGVPSLSKPSAPQREQDVSEVSIVSASAASTAHAPRQTRNAPSDVAPIAAPALCEVDARVVQGVDSEAAAEHWDSIAQSAVEAARQQLEAYKALAQARKMNDDLSQGRQLLSSGTSSSAVIDSGIVHVLDDDSD